MGSSIGASQWIRVRAILGLPTYSRPHVGNLIHLPPDPMICKVVFCCVSREYRSTDSVEHLQQIPSRRSIHEGETLEPIKGIGVDPSIDGCCNVRFCSGTSFPITPSNCKYACCQRALSIIVHFSPASIVSAPPLRRDSSQTHRLIAAPQTRTNIRRTPDDAACDGPWSS